MTFSSSPIGFSRVSSMSYRFILVLLRASAPHHFHVAFVAILTPVPLSRIAMVFTLLICTDIVVFPSLPLYFFTLLIGTGVSFVCTSECSFKSSFSPKDLLFVSCPLIKVPTSSQRSGLIYNKSVISSARAHIIGADNNACQFNVSFF